MIETFGYGRGITNVIHVRGTKHPADGTQSYVATDLVADLVVGRLAYGVGGMGPQRRCSSGWTASSPAN